MLSKKTIQVAALILLVGAALVVGVIQFVDRQADAGVSSQATQTGGPSRASAITVAPDLPAAKNTVAFNENFNKPDKVIPQGWHNLTDVSSTWVAFQGRLEQWGDSDQQPTENTTALVTDDTSFGDSIYQAQVFPMSGEPVGMVFRGSDAGYYRLTLYPNLPGMASDAPRARLERVAADGTATNLGVNTTWTGYAYTQWQLMEVQAIGSHITASVGGTQIFDVNDSGPALNAGWVGVWTIADRGAVFDNVRVQRIVAGR